MMDTATRMRLGWVQLYEETNDAGYVCRRCGISRPTLRKWLRRYKEDGLNGLMSQSKKPKHSPNQKIFEKQEEWILKIRDEMNIGARRIQNELLREYDCHLSLASIQKILNRKKVKPRVCSIAYNPGRYPPEPILLARPYQAMAFRAESPTEGSV